MRMMRRYGKVAALVFVLMIPLLFLYFALKQFQSQLGVRNPNLVVITVDTCRADVLGCYGNPVVYTFSMDRLSRHGVLFPRTYSAVPTTAPAHTTLFTGWDPGHHRVLRNGIVYRERYETMAERLAAVGYHTAAFVSGYSVVARASGLNRGFQYYDDQWSRDRLERRAEETLGAAMRWMSEHPERPYFIWIHLFDPHSPYRPQGCFEHMCEVDSENIVGQPNPDRAEAYRKNVDNALKNKDFKVLVKDPLTSVATPEQVKTMWCLYQAEVSYVDSALQSFFYFLQNQGAMDYTAIVLTSDHGEGFDHDYYFGHGDRLWESAVSVPLIIKYPKDRLKDRISPFVAIHQDVLPTVLAMVGCPAGMLSGQGFDLTHLLENRLPRPKSIWYTAAPPLPKRAFSRGLLVAAYDPRFKLLLNAGTGEMQLYDLANDPLEQTDVSQMRNNVYERLHTLLLSYLNTSNYPLNIRMTDSEEKLKKQLSQLGYIDEDFSGER